MADLARYAGDIYFGPLNSSGEFQGFLPPIEVDAFTPGREEGDELTIKSKRRATYDQNIFSEKSAGSTTLELALLEQPSWVLAVAFAGDETVLSVSSSAVSDESVAVPVLDRDYKLAQLNLSNIVVTNAAASVTYVEDTDYTVVDARLGLIRPLSTGSISAGDTILVDYDYAAFDGFQILGETQLEKRFRIYADLRNRITNKDLSVEYFDVKLSAPDVFDLLSSDVISLNLSGTASTPTGQSSPYRVIGNNVAT